jgi:hypothetical protein
MPLPGVLGLVLPGVSGSGDSCHGADDFRAGVTSDHGLHLPWPERRPAGNERRRTAAPGDVSAGLTVDGVVFEAQRVVGPCRRLSLRERLLRGSELVRLGPTGIRPEPLRMSPTWST